MLSKPEYGWTTFQLENTQEYGLSYTNDIPFEWIDKAINGLKTLLPFCVHGFMEPDRMLCTVSYWNCHIICENDERTPLVKEETTHEYSHTTMLQFCKTLHDDIKENIDEWANFVDYTKEDFKTKKEKLTQKLIQLEKLIEEKEIHFSDDYCFL